MNYLIAPYHVDGVANSTLEECLTYLSNPEITEIGIDTETSAHPEYQEYPDAGLDPYKSRAVMLQIGDIHNQ